NDISLLISSCPTRPRTAFDFKGDDFVRYRVGAEMRDASLHDGFVLFWRSRVAVATCELGKVGSQCHGCVAAVTVEYDHALARCRKHVNPAAIRADVDI